MMPAGLRLLPDLRQVLGQLELPSRAIYSNR
jgi:hypothetical protein